MVIIEKRLSELTPYKNNPRKNDNAVDAVAASIKEFGFKVPIVIDKNGEIVAGHTRYKAAKKLKLDNVPCLIADDLTDDQIKAFRLVENRCGEMSEWDFALLGAELDGLTDFPLDDLVFPSMQDDEPPEEEKPIQPKIEDRLLHLELFMPSGVGEYGIPEILPEDYEPRLLAPFSDANSFKGNPQEYGLHFFLDDYRFERLWNNPKQYISQLAKFSFVLSPDFSLFMDTPKAVQIWNHYRKHWLGAFWQAQGIKVFPTICWSDKASFDWCFDGEPKNAPVFVSSVGVRKSKESIKLFLAGYEAMKEKLSPSLILHYGKPIDEIAGEVEEIEAFQEKFKR